MQVTGTFPAPQAHPQVNPQVLADRKITAPTEHGDVYEIRPIWRCYGAEDWLQFLQGMRTPAGRPLSATTKLLMILISSFNECWFSVEHAMERLEKGRSTIEACLADLVACNLIERVWKGGRRHSVIVAGPRRRDPTSRVTPSSSSGVNRPANRTHKPDGKRETDGTEEIKAAARDAGRAPPDVDEIGDLEADAALHNALNDVADRLDGSPAPEPPAAEPSSQPARRQRPPRARTRRTRRHTSSLPPDQRQRPLPLSPEVVTAFMDLPEGLGALNLIQRKLLDAHPPARIQRAARRVLEIAENEQVNALLLLQHVLKGLKDQDRLLAEQAEAVRHEDAEPRPRPQSPEPRAQKLRGPVKCGTSAIFESRRNESPSPQTRELLSRIAAMERETLAGRSSA